MQPEGRYTPVVLMIDDDSHEALAARDWIDRSPYISCNANDIFEAIEEMADFTMGHRPEVIVLGVSSCRDDLDHVRETLKSRNFDNDVAILALSNGLSPDAKCFEGDLEAVTSRLERLMPDRPRV